MDPGAEEESLLLLLPAPAPDEAEAGLIKAGGVGAPPPLPSTRLLDEAAGNIDDRRRVSVATTT
jgi:hypothetical protein